jgi:hypothetical protein
LGISWREVLGLLIGLAICYGVISYAVTNAPQNRETALDQTQENSLPGAAKKQTTSATSEGDTKAVTLRVTGSSGESFGANYGNLDSSRTVEGVSPTDYEIRVRTDPRSGDYIAATAWKTAANSKELKVQVVDNGKVVKESKTTEDYGAASIRWSPNERPTQTTTSSTEKTGENTNPQP